MAGPSSSRPLRQIAAARFPPALSPQTRTLKIPVVGEVLTATYVVPMLRRRRRHRYGAINKLEMADRFDRQARIPGFGRALLSMFRNGTLEDQSHHYAALGHHGINTLMIWGEDDIVVSKAQLERVRELSGATRAHGFPEMEHKFLMSHASEVAPTIVQFMLNDA